MTVYDGQEFFVVLKADAEAGYGWRLAEAPNPKVARVLSARHEGGRDFWTCEATGRGKTAMVWHYVRRADPNHTPLKVYRTAVEVR